MLAFIGRGYSIPQIAEKLFRSQKTIETHRQSLGRKLGVSNRVELARLAIQFGLAPLDTERGPRQTHHDDPRRQLTGNAFAAQAVSEIESACASVVGEAYCRALIERLPQTLDTAGAAMMSLQDDEPGSARNVATRHREAWIDDGRLNIHNAPCEKTMADGFYARQRDVAEHYAGRLIDLPYPVQSYMGVRLDDPASGEAVGILFIFQDHPIDFNAAAEAVLRVCATRAAAELAQMRLIDSLQRSVETLEERLAARDAK